jgi:hypothetical protein
MQMELEILILKKATKYASFKMVTKIKVKDPTRFYKFIMFYKIEGAKGLSFLRKGGVTYMIGYGAILDFCSVHVVFVLGFRC